MGEFGAPYELVVILTMLPFARSMELPRWANGHVVEDESHANYHTDDQKSGASSSG